MKKIFAELSLIFYECIFTFRREKFFFWLLKHLNKRLLKKYFPLNENDLQIKLENLPHIYINEQENHCNISFNLGLKNYTNYYLFISSIEIRLVVNSYHLLNYDKVILKNFGRKEGTAFFIELPLTYYQVRRIVQMLSSSSNVLNANFELKIPSKNFLGDKLFDRRLFGRIEVKYLPLNNA